MAPAYRPEDRKEEGRELVAALVARFAANEDYFLSADYDETSTREEFINGLLDALGWDVLDVAGRGRNREVIFHPQ